MAENTPTGKTSLHRRRFKSLWEAAKPWRTRCADLQKYVLHDRGRYLTGDDEKSADGSRRYKAIINGTARIGVRTLAAGMQGGLTSPTRPWFSLGLEDRDLLEQQDVREWLHIVTSRMLTIFARSNFYESMHDDYTESAGFGTSVMLIEEDHLTVARFTLLTAGEYVLGLNAQRRVDTLYRKFPMTALQLQEKFGRKVLSDPVKIALDTGGSENTEFQVIHCIQPNPDPTPGSATREGMSYESVYFEEAATDEDVFLRRKGYNEQPFAVVRWSFSSTDTYGGCPVFDAIGDIRMLQTMEKKKLKKLDKHVDPPMVAPSMMKNQSASIISGAVSYLDGAPGGQGFAPAYQVGSDINDMAQEIQKVENAVLRTLYYDLFLALSNVTKRMTTVEVREVSKETLLMLGPVLSRMTGSKLTAIIDRTFAIMERSGLVPDPPPSIAGRAIKIEFIGTLAQAQLQMGTIPIETVLQFAGAIAPLSPEIVDKVNFDQALDDLSIIAGTPPDIIRSDDEVAQIRAAREQALMNQQRLAAAESMANTGKTMADTEFQDGNALESMAEGLGANA